MTTRRSPFVPVLVTMNIQGADVFSIGQVSVVGTAGAGTLVCVVPPGPCMVSIQSDTASASTAYVSVGAGSVTSANGYPIPSGGNLTFARYQADGPGTLRAVSAGTAVLGFLVSGR